MKKMHLDRHAYSEFVEIYCLLLRTLFVCNDWFKVDSSIGLSADSNRFSLMRSLIWGPSNTPAVIFASLFCGNFSWRNANYSSSLSNASTKFFSRPSLTWRGGSNILIGSTQKEEKKALWDAGYQHGYPTSIYSKDVLYNSLEVQGYVQQLWDLYSSTIYVCGN